MCIYSLIFKSVFKIIGAEKDRKIEGTISLSLQITEIFSLLLVNKNTCSRFNFVSLILNLTKLPFLFKKAILISIGKFKDGQLEGEGKTIQYKDQSLKKPTWFYFGKFKNGKAYGKGKSIQEPFDHLHEVKCKDNKILDVKAYKMNKQQIKEFYEDYYDKAINILSFEKYKYNQLPKELRKLIN